MVTETKELIQTGENEFQAARRYREEQDELAQDPQVSPLEVRAKKDTADLLAERAVLKDQLPLPTGEPNKDLESPSKS